MSTNEYVPDDEAMEVAWIEFEASAEDINAAAAEFDRFLARVRRDAWDEGWKHAQKVFRASGTGPRTRNPYETEDQS